MLLLQVSVHQFAHLLLLMLCLGWWKARHTGRVLQRVGGAGLDLVGVDVVSHAPWVDRVHRIGMIVCHHVRTRQRVLQVVPAATARYRGYGVRLSQIFFSLLLLQLLLCDQLLLLQVVLLQPGYL
uniref:Uncharacterized protein n=1 Tax=Cacopsylla melanoneura TaxID=428564 RepID=A0A8D8WKX0_9HEMI